MGADVSFRPLVSRHKLAHGPARIPLFLARYWLPGFLRPRELRQLRRVSYLAGVCEVYFALIQISLTLNLVDLLIDKFRH